jgi:hypothetical protein
MAEGRSRAQRPGSRGANRTTRRLVGSLIVGSEGQVPYSYHVPKGKIFFSVRAHPAV